MGIGATPGLRPGGASARRGSAVPYGQWQTTSWSRAMPWRRQVVALSGSCGESARARSAAWIRRIFVIRGGTLRSKSSRDSAIARRSRLTPPELCRTLLPLSDAQMQLWSPDWEKTMCYCRSSATRRQTRCYPGTPFAILPCIRRLIHRAAPRGCLC